MKEQYVLRMKNVEPGVWLEGTLTAENRTSVVVTGLIFTAAMFDSRLEAKLVQQELWDHGFGKRFEISTIMQGGTFFRPQ